MRLLCPQLEQGGSALNPGCKRQGGCSTDVGLMFGRSMKHLASREMTEKLFR